MCLFAELGKSLLPYNNSCNKSFICESYLSKDAFEEEGKSSHFRKFTAQEYMMDFCLILLDTQEIDAFLCFFMCFYGH